MPVSLVYLRRYGSDSKQGMHTVHVTGDENFQGRARGGGNGTLSPALTVKTPILKM